MNFPDFPEKHLQNDDIRSSYLKVRACWIFYLEEYGKEHNHDLASALATSYTHGIKLHKTPQEYLNLSAQEVCYLEGQLDESPFKNEIELVRKNILSELSELQKS